MNLLGTVRIVGIIDPYDRDPEHERIQELLQSVIDTWVAPPDDDWSGTVYTHVSACITPFRDVLSCCRS